MGVRALLGRGALRKALVAALVFAATGGLLSLAFGDRAPQADPGRSPDTVASLLTEGQVVVGPDGRPVLDDRGRPARIAGDGRTVLDAEGRPLKTRSGAPLVVRRADSGASSRATTRARPGTRARRRAPVARRRGGRRPGAAAAGTAAPEGPPVVIAVTAVKPEAVNDWMNKAGVVQRAPHAVPQIQAVEDYLNAHGGIAGRPADLRAWEFEAFDPTLGLQLCERAKKESPVAVVTPGNGVEAMGECIQKEAGAAYFFNAHRAGPRRWLASRTPFAWATASVAVDRYPRPWIRAIARDGFFAGGRVGVVHDSGHPAFNDEKKEIDAALEEVRVDPVAEAQFSLTLDIQVIKAEARSAALRFKMAGVTRVVGPSEWLLEFMVAARDQDYWPRYAVTSQHELPFMRASGAARMLEDAVGLGWIPVTDVDADAEPAPNPALALCTQIFRDAGVDVGSRSASGVFSALQRCDGVLNARDAIEAGGGDTSQDGIRQGMLRLGDRRAAALTFTTSITPNDVDGATTARILRFRGGRAFFDDTTVALR